MEFVAPDYRTEGIQEFMKYIELCKLIQKINENHICLLAEYEGVPVGMIEVQENSRISLLFVEKTMMGKGIAKELVNRTITICKKQDPTNTRIEVRSSPFAIKIYKKLGFQTTGPSQITTRSVM